MASHKGHNHGSTKEEIRWCRKRQAFDKLLIDAAKERHVRVEERGLINTPGCLEATITTLNIIGHETTRIRWAYYGPGIKGQSYIKISTWFAEWGDDAPHKTRRVTVAEARRILQIEG